MHAVHVNVALTLYTHQVENIRLSAQDGTVPTSRLLIAYKYVIRCIENFSISIGNLFSLAILNRLLKAFFMN